MLENAGWFWAICFAATYLLIEFGVYLCAGRQAQVTPKVELAIYAIAFAAGGFLMGSVGIV